MTFQELIQKIENKIGQEIIRSSWKAKLLGITNRKNHAIRIEVLFSTIDDTFSFTRELKIAAVNFDEDAKYNDEIIRLLKRLNDYSNAIVLLSSISAPPTINNKWKGYLTNLVEKSPIHSILTITYSQLVSGELMTFDQELNVNAESFISRQSIHDLIADNVAKLNTPLELQHYKNLIYYG